MKINEDIAKYNILPTSLAKSLLFLTFDNFLIEGKYDYNSKKLKNKKFCKDYDIDVDKAIELIYVDFDSIEVEYAYEYYKYLRGETTDDARNRIGGLSISDRMKLDSRYTFVFNLPKSIESRNIHGNTNEKIYICIDTENPKRPMLFSFHTIPKNDRISDEDSYDYRVGLWKMKR